MIEVVELAHGWTWTMLSAEGRVLAYTSETYPSDRAANDAAKEYRAACWCMASEIDARQGVSI